MDMWGNLCTGAWYCRRWR